MVMKIKQAEELVGITSKNIRFYEEQGLLQPKRSENGYRNYTQEDVNCLKKIKLLRKFGTSLEEIHRLFQGRSSIKECLEKREEALEREQRSVEKTRMLVQRMLGECNSIDRMDTDFWLDEMEKLEKEGTDFVDLNKVDIHRKKMLGAIAGAGVTILFMLALIAINIWVWINDVTYPIGLFLFVLIMPIIVLGGVFVVMVKRIKEIERGEEDEAAKY